MPEIEPSETNSQPSMGEINTAIEALMAKHRELMNSADNARKLKSGGALAIFEEQAANIMLEIIEWRKQLR